MKQKQRSLDALLKGRGAINWSPAELKKYKKKSAKNTTACPKIS